MCPTLCLRHHDGVFFLGVSSYKLRVQLAALHEARFHASSWSNTVDSVHYPFHAAPAARRKRSQCLGLSFSKKMWS